MNKKLFLILILVSSFSAPAINAWWSFDVCHKCGKSTVAAVAESCLESQPEVLQDVKVNLLQEVARGLNRDWKMVAGLTVGSACVAGMFSWARNKWSGGTKSFTWAAIKSGLLGATAGMVASTAKTLPAVSAETLQTILAENKENILLGVSGAALLAGATYAFYPKYVRRCEKKQFITYLRGLVQEAQQGNTSALNKNEIIKKLPVWLQNDSGLIGGSITSSGSALIDDFVREYNSLPAVQGNLDFSKINKVVNTAEVYLRDK